MLCFDFRKLFSLNTLAWAWSVPESLAYLDIQKHLTLKIWLRVAFLTVNCTVLVLRRVIHFALSAIFLYRGTYKELFSDFFRKLHDSKKGFTVIGGKFKFQAQDSFLEYFFLDLEIWKNFIVLSEKKPPLKSDQNKEF